MHKDKPFQKIQNDVITEQKHNTSTPVDSLSRDSVVSALQLASLATCVLRLM